MEICVFFDNASLGDRMIAVSPGLLYNKAKSRKEEIASVYLDPLGADRSL